MINSSEKMICWKKGEIYEKNLLILLLAISLLFCACETGGKKSNSRYEQKTLET